VSILTLTTGNPVYLILTKVQGGCDRSAEDAYSSMAPDPTFAFVGGPCCLTHDFVFAIWIMIMFYTLWTSLFCIPKIKLQLKSATLLTSHGYMYILTGNNQINVTVCLSIFTAASVVHIMETARIFKFETVVDNDSDADNLQWLCSCNLQCTCTFDLHFYDDIAGECVYFLCISIQ
jgi:hypothetical protein